MRPATLAALLRAYKLHVAALTLPNADKLEMSDETRGKIMDAIAAIYRTGAVLPEEIGDWMMAARRDFEITQRSDGRWRLRRKQIWEPAE